MKISRALLAAIHRHLEQGYPNEACGVLLGRGDTVTEIVPADNTRTDSAHNRYLIDPREYLRIERDADRRGLQLLGIYHSHPDCAPRPSQYDLDHAWPNLTYLIVSVIEGKASENLSWRLRDDRSQFDPDPLELTDTESRS
ncbi:MAG: M67 family metallopeptidase [Verrucomicrobiae bacterium]|nr:M67 family metallopeptidase [Verrucomicrobiae bacterium]